MYSDPTKRFSVRAEAYVRHRPGYPPEILTLLERECGLTPESTVADIGSGTGFLSQLFLRFGCEVFGVEPNAEMRAAGESVLAGEPRFHSVDGRAENTTLPGASMDFVVAGQALHWFDPETARAELGRILKPEGWAVAVWNQRKLEDAGFLGAYEALLHCYAPEYPLAGHHRVNGAMMDRFFGPGGWRLERFSNAQSLDFDGLRGRLESSSYAPLPGSPNHAPMICELERMFDEYRENGRVTLLYETNVYFAPSTALTR